MSISYYKGSFRIYPSLTSDEVYKANLTLKAIKNQSVCNQSSDGSFSRNEARGQYGWYVSMNGKEICCINKCIDESKGYLKFLIEHGIKPTNARVNGEMIYLNEFNNLGILRVINNEVYTICCLKRFFRRIPSSELTIESFKSSLNCSGLNPATFSDTISLMITRDTKFYGSFYVNEVLNMNIYEMIRNTKEESVQLQLLIEELESCDFNNHRIRFVENTRNYLADSSPYPLIAEQNCDGTIGEKSDKNEWIISEDKTTLYWSGIPFIAAHHWLVFLGYRCCNFYGSVIWENERNLLGRLIVEPIHILEYTTRNFVFIEFGGEKYLASDVYDYY